MGGSKFYQTETFKALYKKWVSSPHSKLARSGFEDIETPKGTIKSKNTRTQNYQNQEELQRISSALIYYIEHSKNIPPKEKKILELHAHGTYQKEIMKITKVSAVWIWKVIKKHRPIALGIYSIEEAS